MKTSCPHCGQHYELEDSFAGQPVTCERCWKDFTVPAEKPSAAVPPPEPKPEPAKAPAAEKSKIPAPAVPVAETPQRCPYCSGAVPAGVKKCRHCGEWIDRSAKPQNPIVYTLLALLLGGIGMHNFVNGQWCEGIGKILIFLTGLQIVHVWPYHPLGYIVFGALEILILVEIVKFYRGTPPALKGDAKLIATMIAGGLLVVSLVYGLWYQGEVGAVEASYYLAYSRPAEHSKEEASARFDRLRDCPLANYEEIRDAMKRGIEEGLEAKYRMEKLKDEK